MQIPCQMYMRLVRSARSTVVTATGRTLPMDRAHGTGRTTGTPGMSDDTTICERVEEHGTRSSYQKGCRCEACRKANREYKARRQAHNKASTKAATEACIKAGMGDRIPSLEHGKANTYYYHGCRCADCKEVVRKEQKQYRRTRVFIQMSALL